MKLGFESNGKVLPFVDGQKIPLVFNSNIFSFGEIVGDFSYPVMLPPTKEVSEFFGFVDLPISPVSIRKEYEGKIVGDTSFIQTVKLIVRKASKSGFEADLQSGVSYISAWKDKKISTILTENVIDIRSVQQSIVLRRETSYWAGAYQEVYINNIVFRENYASSDFLTMVNLAAQINAYTWPAVLVITAHVTFPDLEIKVTNYGFNWAFDVRFITFSGGVPQPWTILSSTYPTQGSVEEWVTHINAHLGEFYPTRNHVFFPVLNTGAQTKSNLPSGTATQINAFKLSTESFDLTTGSLSTYRCPYIVAFPFLYYVLTQIAKTIGASIDGHVSVDDMFKKIVCYNNYSMDAKYWIRQQEDVYNLLHNLPDMTIQEFFLNVVSAFNLQTSLTNGKLFLNYTRDIIENNSFVLDLTLCLVGEMTVEDAGFTGFDMFWEEADDPYLKYSKYVVDKSLVTTTVPTVSDLSSISMSMLGKTVYVSETDTYYESQMTGTGVVWIPVVERFEEAISGDGSKSVRPAVNSLAMTTDAGMRMPVTSHEMNSSDPSIKATPLGLRFLFYHGFLSSASGNRYEYGSSDNIDPTGSIIPNAWNLLKWNGPDNHYDKFWKTTVEYLMRAKRYKAPMMLDAVVFNKLMMYRSEHGYFPKIQVNNVVYIVETIETSIPLTDVSRFTLIRSTWLQS